MSIQVTYPQPVNATRLKQFFWDVKDRRTVPRGIGGYYNVDTTAVTNNTGATATVKTYTFTSSANTNAIRVRVYGSASSSTLTYTFYLLINGTQVKTGSTSSTSSVLVIDYIGSLTPNTNYTIQVQVTNGGTVNQVTIIAGFGLTSTTAVNILTINLDPANDTYTLNVNGNFVYTLGIRWWAKGNRKTTATATIVSNLVNEIQSNTYSPTAADDGDSNVFLTLRTGNYATSFTISGNVGASGDVIIITEIYCQIVLRGNLTDSFNTLTSWDLLIKEKGMMTVTSRHVTIDGSSMWVGFYFITSSGFEQSYQSSFGSDVRVSNLIFSTNDAPEVTWQVGYQDDIYGFTVLLYVNIIIIGA